MYLLTMPGDFRLVGKASVKAMTQALQAGVGGRLRVGD